MKLSTDFKDKTVMSSKFTKKKIVFAVSMLILLFCDCSHKVNEIGYESFTEDGQLKQEIINDFFSAETADSIQFYVETSGSMNGLFRARRANAFKTDMSTVLSNSKLNVIGVKAFIDGSSKTRSYSPSSFRQNMNDGSFVSAQNTEVPKMMEAILANLNDKECDVAVFVSDMKYSPKGNSATALSQYSLDIKNMFDKYRDYAVSVIGLESEFLDPNGKIICDCFPYYMIVIGKSPKVSLVRNIILSELEKNGHVQGCIDFNQFYGCPYYSVLPVHGTTGGLRQNPHETSTSMYHLYLE